MTTLRQEADRAAKSALAGVLTHHLYGRSSDPLVDDTYRAAERVVDAVEEYERCLDQSMQAADPQAPDYYGAFDYAAETRYDR